MTFSPGEFQSLFLAFRTSRPWLILAPSYDYGLVGFGIQALGHTLSFLYPRLPYWDGRLVVRLRNPPETSATPDQQRTECCPFAQDMKHG